MALSAPRSILDPAGPLVRRRRVDRLSDRQLAALRRAVAALQSDGGYAELAELYPRHLPRLGVTWLPWNRAYLRAFEAALLERVPGVALPWWDWFQQHAVPRAFYSLAEDTEPNPLEVERSRGKAKPPDLPGSGELRSLLSEPDYARFTVRLEDLHNLVHAWAGQPLDDVRTAPQDPLFWALQATVDRTWRLWQQRHPDFTPPPPELDARLEPFGATFGDVLDTRALGYDYADLPRPRTKGDAPEQEQEPWRPSRPGYRSDEVDEVPVDQLGIESEVEALCWVIAARDTVPPLSIGLFGGWGSGKSTFMALMRARVDELAEQARSRPDGESPWCPNVLQITFNAWTYADDNLWASLVTDILHALAVPATYRPGADEQQDGVLGAIARRRIAAKRERTSAQLQINAASKRLEQLPASPGELAHDALVGDASSEAATQLADDPVVKGVRDAVGAAVGTDAAAAVDKTVTAAAGLATLTARLRALGRFLRGDGALRGRARLLVALSVLLLVAAIAGLTLTGTWESALAILGAVASFFGAIKPLLDAEAALRKGHADLTDKLEAQRAEQRQVLADAKASREHADAELARIESGEAVHDYFAERAVSSDYTARMGLLATIRRDFGDLRTWLRDPKRPGPATDRIILYVDDLDRCSSARVVEVLEAVHLLLALDLFVVVVGVDPRWLLGSLEDRFSAQFARRGRAGRGWQTTPEDFLEKIFQIPFTVRPMDAAGFERLMFDLLPGQRSAAASAIPDGPAAAPQAATGPAPAEPALASAADLALESEESDPVGLRLAEAELAFLTTLSELVPTPRAAKRLANTYRLLRAPLEQRELETLVAKDHRVVLVLLAALVGSSSGAAARALGALLAEPADSGWGDFLERLAAAPVGAETRRLACALQLASPEAELAGSVEPFQRWTPRVARYSFETARLTAEPIA
jgi:KAP family P-loop domain/Common central domain of tyrosinase